MSSRSIVVSGQSDLLAKHQWRELTLAKHGTNALAVLDDFARALVAHSKIQRPLHRCAVRGGKSRGASRLADLRQMGPGASLAGF